MINHARTLLTNLAATGDYSVPGEEYVAPDFQPVRLPTPLQVLRRALYGHDPDRALLNVRTRRYLKVLEASELEEHVRYLDPRITYLPNGREHLDTDHLPRIRQRWGPEVLLEPFGELGLHVGGRLYWAWWVLVMGPGREPADLVTAANFPGGDAVIGVVSRRDAPTVATSTLRPDPFLGTFPLSYSFDFGDLPAWFAEVEPICSFLTQSTTPFESGVLQRSMTAIRLVDHDSAGFYYRPTAATPNTAQLYWVDGYGRDTADLVQIEQAVRNLSVETLAYLFDSADSRVQMFGRLWEQHPYWPYRLGGLLLAYLYRVEELRIQQAP